MENASKALIIAGAILLSILIISLGIMIYNNAKGTVTDANLDSEQAQAFNGKFTIYAGRQRTASDVNALVAAVQSNNSTNANTRITMTLTGLTQNTHWTGPAMVAPTANNPGTYNMVFSNSFKYNVTYTTATANTAINKIGYVNAITITLAVN